MTRTLSDSARSIQIARAHALEECLLLLFEPVEVSGILYARPRQFEGEIEVQREIGLQLALHPCSSISSLVSATPSPSPGKHTWRR